MADKKESLKEASSYSTLLRAMDDAATPLPIRLLRQTQTGRVIEDGLAVGTQSLLSSIAGLPVDLYEFAKERVKGVKSATPETERVGSSAWLEKKMETFYTEGTKMLGRERPVIDPASNEAMIHLGAKMTPIIGSFFIPGVGGAKMASMGSKLGKVGELAGHAAGKVGVQLAVADIATVGIEFGENIAGVERPVESQKLASETKSSAQPKGILAIRDAKSSIVNVATPQQDGSKQQSYDAKNISILGQVLTGNLKNKDSSDAFDVNQVKALQTALVSAGHLKASEKHPKPVDGIMGAETVSALDAAIKKTLQPASVTGDIRQSHIQNMARLSDDLKQNPAGRYNFDPRVVELQTNAYALGLYNKKIDGLAGPDTLKAISSLESVMTESPKGLMARAADRVNLSPSPAPS